MDVGLTVNNTGLISALFALLACIALCVELGNKPAKVPEHASDAEKKKAGERKGKKGKSAQKSAGKGSQKRGRKTAAVPDEKVERIDDDIETLEATRPLKDRNENARLEEHRLAKEFLAKTLIESSSKAEAPATSKEAASASASDNGSDDESTLPSAQVKIQDSMRKIVDLQRRFVDGFLGPRGKYDIAIAVLNELQSIGAGESKLAETMATEAYLSATRSTKLTDSREALSQSDTGSLLPDADKIDNE